MISLYESILQSTKAGKRSLIEKWLSDTKNVFGPQSRPLKYKLNADNSIVVEDDYFFLPFEEYTSLPDYIHFAEYKGDLHVGKSGSFSEHRVDSFRGFPKKVKNMSLYCGIKTTCLPKLEIELSERFLYSGPKVNMTEGIYIKFNDEERGSRNARTIQIDFFDVNFTCWHVENCNTINLKGDPRLAKDFANNVNQKYTRLNSKTGPLEYPIEEKGVQQMKTYFGGIDLSTVEYIILQDHIAIQKINGKFYKLRT